MRHDLHHPNGKPAPITLRIAEACRVTGIGRSKFYELIRAGEVETVKIGAMTLVPVSSIEALIERGRAADGEGSFGRNLRAVMHPFLADAILSAELAKAPEMVRRDLASSNAGKRAKAEDALVERLVAALYEGDGQAMSGSG